MAVELPPVVLVTDRDGKPLKAYHRNNDVGQKLRWVEDGRAFVFDGQGAREVTTDFWWGCYNVSTDGRGPSTRIPGREWQGGIAVANYGE